MSLGERLGGVDSRDSLFGSKSDSRLLSGGSLGCEGPIGFERRGVGADGALIIPTQARLATMSKLTLPERLGPRNVCRWLRGDLNPKDCLARLLGQKQSSATHSDYWVFYQLGRGDPQQTAPKTSVDCNFVELVMA
jgi:hypothetical protein